MIAPPSRSEMFENAVVRLLDPGIACDCERDDCRDRHHQQNLLLVGQARQCGAQTIGQILCAFGGLLGRGSGCRHAWNNV